MRRPNITRSERKRVAQSVILQPNLLIKPSDLGIELGSSMKEGVKNVERIFRSLRVRSLTDDKKTLDDFKINMEILTSKLNKIIKNNDSTPDIQIKLNPLVQKVQETFTQFISPAQTYFNMYHHAQDTTDRNQVLSTANVQIQIKAFSKAWKELTNLINMYSTASPPPHAQEITSKFKGIRSTLEVISQANETKKHPSLSLSKSVLNLQCLCNSISTNIVTLFSQRDFQITHKNSYNGFKTDVKSFLKVINEAFSNEFPQGGVPLCDLSRFKLNIYAACGEIIEALKAAFQFPTEMAEIQRLNNKILSETREIMSMLSEQFNIVKPKNGISSSPSASKNQLQNAIHKKPKEKEKEKPKQELTLLDNTRKVEMFLTEILPLFGLSYTGDNDQDPWFTLINLEYRIKNLIENSRRQEEELEYFEKHDQEMKEHIKVLESLQIQKVYNEKAQCSTLKEKLQQVQEQFQDCLKKNKDLQKVVNDQQNEMENLVESKKYAISTLSAQSSEDSQKIAQLQGSLIEINQILYSELNPFYVPCGNSDEVINNQKKNDEKTNIDEQQCQLQRHENELRDLSPEALSLETKALLESYRLKNKKLQLDIKQLQENSISSSSAPINIDRSYNSNSILSPVEDLISSYLNNSPSQTSPLTRSSSQANNDLKNDKSQNTTPIKNMRTPMTRTHRSTTFAMKNQKPNLDFLKLDDKSKDDESAQTPKYKIKFDLNSGQKDGIGNESGIKRNRAEKLLHERIKDLEREFNDSEKNYINLLKELGIKLNELISGYQQLNADILYQKDTPDAKKFESQLSELLNQQISGIKNFISDLLKQESNNQSIIKDYDDLLNKIVEHLKNVYNIFNDSFPKNPEQKDTLSDDVERKNKRIFIDQSISKISENMNPLRQEISSLRVQLHEDEETFQLLSSRIRGLLGAKINIPENNKERIQFLMVKFNEIQQLIDDTKKGEKEQKRNHDKIRDFLCDIEVRYRKLAHGEDANLNLLDDTCIEQRVSDYLEKLIQI